VSALLIANWERAADEDAFDRTPASEFLPCQSCMDFRAELERLTAQLAKAHALLRLLRRIEARPGKPDGLDDDPMTLALIAHAVAIATMKARIDLYLQATGQRL
jgi:hypothetical protein